MGIEVDTFVDAHCHMFTVADVPLSAIIKRQVDHPLRLIAGSLAVPLAIKWFDKFIKYFDSESLQNVKLLTGELNRAIGWNKLGDFQVTAPEKIMTPLVMDFDLNGDVKKSGAQLQRLVDAAKTHWAGSRAKAVKVLPFVGLDPRKLVFKNGKDGELLDHPQIGEKTDKFLEENKVKNAASRRDRPNLQGGDVIGVKIYPPLGFKVYPDTARERDAYQVVYERLAELEIPITAHCQKASFDLTDGELKLFTDPRNWADLLGSSETIRKLRLNLGHFGGEKGVIDALDWEDDRVEGPSRDGWTYEIIKILKRYDNAYADISAFDFGDKQAVASLLWTLAYDKAGEFNDNDSQSPNHPLESKLLWGSDYPMILDKDYENYTSYFADFINSLIRRKDLRKKSRYAIPKESQLPGPAPLLRRLISTNPVEFLFG
jgi:hypothetical protein